MRFDTRYPIISKRRKGDSESPFIFIKETHQVVNGKCVLSEIPNEFNKVQVEGLNVEWYETKSVPKENEFNVDYRNGIVTLNSSRNGEQLEFSYYGMGVEFFPSQRVWVSEQNGNVVETLDDIIDTSQDKINTINQKITETNEKLIEADEVLDTIQNQTDNVIEEFENKVNSKITEANQKINETNQVKNATEQTRQTILTDYENVVKQTKVVILPFVETYAQIATTYPNPQLGYTVQVKADGIEYRYNGTQWQPYRMSGLISNGEIVSGSLPPENVNVLWVDEENNLKFHNHETDQWEEVKLNSRFKEYQNKVVLSQNASNVVIGIPEYNKNDDVLLVVANGITLTKGEDYTIAQNGISINKKNGTWNKDTEFNFTVLKTQRVEHTYADGSLISEGSVTDNQLAEGIRISPALTDKNGVVHPNLKERLLKTDEQLAQTGYEVISLKNDKADKTEVNSLATIKADKTFVTTELDKKRDKSAKVEPEELSERSLALVTGQGTINLQSIPQNDSVTNERLSPQLRESLVFPINNEILNGNFNGTANWQTSGTTPISLLTAENNTMTVKPNPNATSPRIVVGTLRLKGGANEKIYLRYLASASREEVMNIGVGSGVFGSSTYGNQFPTVSPTTKVNSHIFTANSNGINFFMIQISAMTNPDDFIKLQLVSGINLTKIFGAGKEPTKEEMDAYFERNVWFDGSRNIKQDDLITFRVKPMLEKVSIKGVTVVAGAGDGVTDDTNAIQSALNAGAGGTVLLPHGTHIVSKTLYIPDNTRLVGVGAGSVIKLASNAVLDSILWRTFDGGYIIKPILTNNRNSAQAKNIYVKSIRITGEGVTDSVERMGGLIFADAFNCHAEDVYVTHINWTNQNTINFRGFNIACVRSEKISFIKTITDFAGYECIGTFDDSKDVIVSENIIGTGKRCSAQIHRNNFNITFDSNICKQNQQTFTDAHGCLVIHGSETRPAKGLIITNNQFEALSEFAVVSFVEFQEDVVFSNNRLNGLNMIGLRLNGINKNYTIQGNQIKVNGSGMIIRSLGGVSIVGNIVDSATSTGTGVDIDTTESLVFNGNTIKSGRNGLRIGTVEHGVIVDGNIIQAGLNSFASDYSTNPKIRLGQNIA